MSEKIWSVVRGGTAYGDAGGLWLRRRRRRRSLSMAVANQRRMGARGEEAEEREAAGEGIFVAEF